MAKRLCMIVLAALAAFGAPAALAAEPFDAAEREQIEQVIRDYLLAHPELLVEVMDALEAKQKADAAAKNDRLVVELHPEIFRSAYDFVANPDGRIPVVEFFDYQCGYCKRVLPALQEVRENESDVRVIYKEFPILGPASVYASRVAIAARRQGKYLALHDALMGLRGHLDEEMVLETASDVGLDVEQLKRDMEDPEIEETIAFNKSLAERMDVHGTPTLLVGQTVLPGAVPLDRLIATIEETRSNCTVC